MRCEKCFRPFSKRSEELSRLSATLAYTRSFCEFVGVWTVNIFSSVNYVLDNLVTVSRRGRRLQDVAPAHSSRKTVALLTAHVPNFIEPENWPPNSPNSNPVDYSIWGALQQLVYRQRIRDIEHLKEVLTAARTLSNGLLDSFASDYHWLSQKTEDILNITLTEISCALRKF